MASTSLLLLVLLAAAAANIPTVYSSLDSSPLSRGFVVSPTQISLQWNGGVFRPFLTSPNGRFCLGFQEVSHHAYVLSVMYTIRNETASSSQSSLDMEPINMAMVWSANGQNPGSGASVFSINQQGRMALVDGSVGSLWSPDFAGQQLRLLDSGNLVLSVDAGIVWQSFDNPTDTLLPEQNFTASMNLSVSISQTIASVNGTFYLKMEADGMALYADLGQNASDLAYFRLPADQATASINKTLEPIYARIESMGYLGMYQKQEKKETRVSFDVFKTYNVTEIVHRRMRLDGDGNLRVYYWGNSKWEVDLEAVTEMCEMPSVCGPYGVCNRSGGDDGGKCECAKGEVMMWGSKDQKNESEASALRMVSVNGSDARQGCAGSSSSSSNVDDEMEAKCSPGSGERQNYVRLIGVDSVFRSVAAESEAAPPRNSTSAAFSNPNNASLDDCQTLCDADCLCVAFFFTNTSPFSCFLSYHTALAMQSSSLPSSFAYIKLSSIPLLLPNLPNSSSGLRRSSVEVIVSAAACLVAFGVVFLLVLAFVRHRRSRFSSEEVTALRK